MKKISKTIIFGFIFTLSPLLANASSLSFSPSKTTVKPGSIFTVTVIASSGDKAINTVSGAISFDPLILDAAGISKTGSIIAEWKEGPTRSNKEGTVTFNGSTQDSGYIGSNGKLFTITFRARREGDAKLNFTAGSILEKDGVGENSLSSMEPISISISEGQIKEIAIIKDEPQVEVKNDLINSGIVIRSISHPKEGKWYSDNTPDISWTLPGDATEIKTIISKSKTKVPNVSYVPPIFEKTIDLLADGKYFFSIQAKTTTGWTPIERRSINIDSIPPQAFSITIADEIRDKYLPPAIIFRTTDSISDNLRYEVKIGEEKILQTTEHKIDNPFQLPSQNPGTYVVSVSAFDEAENVRTETIGFTIEAIAIPKLVSFPSEVISGSKEIIKGITYPNAIITLYYKSGDKVIVEEMVKSSEKGDFVIPVTDKLEIGSYVLTARVTDQNGAKSNETSPIVISFKPFYRSLSFIVYSVLSIIVIITILTVVFMRKRHERSNIKNITKTKDISSKTNHLTEHSFDILREDIRNRIVELETMRPKRKFIDKEIVFLEELESSLLEAKGVILEDINKIPA